MKLRKLLGIPQLYSAFSRVAGGDARIVYAREYIRAFPEARVLDIGCGTADILEFLPSNVEYVGFDASESYIESARARFGARGQFYCADVASQVGQAAVDFDIVLANGVLHHLDDDEAVDLFRIARSALKPGGRLVTLDGCYVEGQSRVAKFLLSKDRGTFVRTVSGYRRLASFIFAGVNVDIRHDLMRIPYTHIIMVCSQHRATSPSA